MKIDDRLALDERAVFRALGGRGAAPDPQSAGQLALAGQALEQAAEPRWVHRVFGLEQAPLRLQGAELALPGQDIAAHLEGCDACVLLAVTLGAGVERLTRQAQATDMARAVLLDAAASTLVEQYADWAEAVLRDGMAEKGQYLTGRFSPGYGDLPIAIQSDFLRVLGAQKGIGLTVSASGIMLPRKSITAVLGLAGHPVSGKLAGCEHCALRESCHQGKEGRGCGQMDCESQ